MTEYIYIVKCDGCEDEMFNFFTDARMQCDLVMSKHPSIQQIEVERNDFGECIDSCDLGTVWSWEDLMKETDAEPTVSVFTSGDFAKYNPDNDPEFDALDNSVDSEIEKVSDKKPIPEGMTIEQLVEEMEENEDTVECVCCQELYPKEECKYDEKHGWICTDCADEVVECTWCEELYDRSQCRREVDLGWLCDRCEAAIKSRGETLTFREGNYWDFLDEDVEDTRSLADLVKDSINHLTNDLGKDPWADDFADDVIADIEHNYDTHVPEDMEHYGHWCSAVASEVSRQVNNQCQLDEEPEAVQDLGNTYDGGYPAEAASKSTLDILEESTDYRARLELCPECGTYSFDKETGICINCGFNC